MLEGGRQVEEVTIETITHILPQARKTALIPNDVPKNSKSRFRERESCFLILFIV